MGYSLLKLRIENFDKLHDSGTLGYSVNKRGFELGQNSHFDLTLPNRSGAISVFNVKCGFATYFSVVCCDKLHSNILASK